MDEDLRTACKTGHDVGSLLATLETERMTLTYYDKHREGWDKDGNAVSHPQACVVASYDPATETCCAGASYCAPTDNFSYAEARSRATKRLQGMLAWQANCPLGPNSKRIRRAHRYSDGTGIPVGVAFRFPRLAFSPAALRGALELLLPVGLRPPRQEPIQ